MVDIASEIERMGQSMGAFVMSTAPEVLDTTLATTDSGATRSVLQLVAECVATNDAFAAILQGKTVTAEGRADYDVDLLDAEAARFAIVDSSKKLADAIRNLSLADPTQTFETWRGPIRAERIAIGAYRNMAYHSGQINFIQILLGDSEFHVPDTWY